MSQAVVRSWGSKGPYGPRERKRKDEEMSSVIDTFKFEFKGRDFRRVTHEDYDVAAPWAEEDRGVVSDAKTRDQKSPGERPLKGSYGRQGYRYYDWERSTQKAKEQGWWLGKDDIAELAKTLGRDPTRKQIIREAVQRDFDRINRWLNDEWCYVWIEVEDTVTENNTNCGGFESDDETGIAEYALNAAAELYDPPLLVELMDRKLKECAA